MNSLLRYTGPIGGRVKETPAGSGVFVRIKQSDTSSVVFLGHPVLGDDNDITPVGTGFLFYSNETEDTYLVTAAHVAAAFEDAPLCVRMVEKKTDNARVLRFENCPKWYLHPSDDTLDIAVMPFETPGWAWSEPLSDGKVVDSKIRQSREFGAGDMAYVIGLYTFVKGKKRNLPFVHTGHIASMVDSETISWPDWRDTNKYVDIEGHMVSAHTIKGASGSPVFVRETMYWNGTSPDSLSAGDSTWLLGVWKGLYTRDEDGNQQIPRMGLAVPATKILEIMKHPELQERKRSKQKKKAAHLASITEDQSASKAESGGDALLKNMLSTPPKRHGT